LLPLAHFRNWLARRLATEQKTLQIACRAAKETMILTDFRVAKAR
jgi:hypothetical protein